MDNELINTGLTIQGFEVWALPPDHYRHYHEVFLEVAQDFETEVREEREGSWEIGFTRPDSVFRSLYGGYSTRAEAEAARERLPAARVRCQFEVWRRLPDGRRRGVEADTPGAVACGAIWNSYLPFAPFQFNLTPSEAESVIRWRLAADAEWFAAHPDFLPRERRIVAAQCAGLPPGAAEFVVGIRDALGDDAVAIVGKLDADALECLECGAVYQESGHVEAGQMGCDRCG